MSETKTRRGTTNRNQRGSAMARRARRAWLLKVWESNLGPGVVRCYRCGAPLRDDDRLTVDRIIPGALGGRYTRDNIRPACCWCNSETGALVRTQKRMMAFARKAEAA